MAYDFPASPSFGQTYQGYTWDGEKWLMTLASPNTGGVVAIQVFTSSGFYVPSANMTTAVIECIGGGGGGGAAVGMVTASYTFSGGGGGSGGYSRKFVTAATIGASQSVTIGAGGNGGAAGANNGSAGADTSVGSLCIAKGGAGGLYGAQAQVGGGGAGGIKGTGDVTTTGSPGGGGVYSVTPQAASSSSNGGGNSVLGGGGLAPICSGGAVLPGVAGAANTGGGGSGATAQTLASNAAGGNGGSGLVIITEYGIAALGSAAASTGAVRYDVVQGLTASQKIQARANIDVLKKNYIINGAMMISQENGTTAGTTSGYYPVDNFVVSFTGSSGAYSTQQIASPTPSGSPSRFRVTVTTADAAVGAGDLVWIIHNIEGLRVADLRFGSASARTVTLQFGVKAPAGTYCVALVNGTATPNRSYVAEYVIAAGEANTDVVKSVVIPGDTTGTWNVDTSKGFEVRWGLMVGTTWQQAAGAWGIGNAVGSLNQFNFMGTNGNIFELFDVGLYEGTVAPAFQVPDYPGELQLCQRYYNKLVGTGIGGSSYTAGTSWLHTIAIPTMRPGATAVLSNQSYSNASGYSVNFVAPGFVRVIATGTGAGNWTATGDLAVTARL